MMDPTMTRDEHPEEGMIHAWLDGELDPQAAGAMAAHVESCASCAARVAEARGLIAGASRVVGALDDAPAALPAWGSGRGGAEGGGRPAWRRFRLTPTRAAIAATVLVAAGVTLTYQRTGPDTVAGTHARAKSAASPAAAAAAPALATRDPLLDSAIKRKLAAAQPPRAVEAAAEPGLPVAPPTVITPDTVAPVRVAAGRLAVRSVRETTSAVADRARTSGVAGASGAATGASGVASVAKVIDSAANPAREARAARPTVQTATSIPLPRECYRVESANGARALWGSVEAPFIVALDASGGGARVLTADGVDTGTGATWTRSGADSILVRLRRLGFQGTLALGTPGDVRSGVMRSAPLALALGEVVTTAAGTESAPPTMARRRARTRVDQPAASTSANKAPGSPAVAADAVNAAPAVPIIARQTACPSR
jgi:hypothetical protein